MSRQKNETMKPQPYTPREPNNDWIEAVVFIIVVIIAFMLAGCATKRVATTTQSIDKSTVKTDSTTAKSWRDELLKDKSVTITWTEAEETTTEAVTDSAGTVVVPAQKKRNERTYTAQQNNITQAVKDSTQSATVSSDVQKDVVSTSEEKIIPQARTAMWVFFSLALCALVGGVWWVKRKFF